MDRGGHPSRFQIQPGRHGTSIFTHYIPCVCDCVLLCPIHTFEIIKRKRKCERKEMENFPFLASALLYLRLRWGCSNMCLLVVSLAFAFASLVWTSLMNYFNLFCRFYIFYLLIGGRSFATNNACKKRTIELFFTASLKRSCQHNKNQNCSGWRGSWAGEADKNVGAGADKNWMVVAEHDHTFCVIILTSIWALYVNNLTLRAKPN